MKETVMNLQNKIRVRKERELNLLHAMEIPNIKMKILKEELHAIKNQMPELERKMLNLKLEKEMLLKANVEIKSTLEEKEYTITTKWKRCY